MYTAFRKDVGMWTMLFLLIFSSVKISAQHVVFGKNTPVSEKIMEAQRSNVPFTSVKLFKAESKSIERSAYGGVLGQATVAHLNTMALQKIAIEQPEAIQMEVPFLNGSIEVEMVKVQILTDDFMTTVSGSDSRTQYTPGAYYRGIVKGDASTVVGISFFEDEVIGLISSESLGNVSMNKMDESGEYLIYSDRDLSAQNPNYCSAEEPEGYAEKIEKYMSESMETRDVKCVRVYIECDYALFQNKGSVTAVNNWITAVFNNMATLYANEQIVIQLSATHVWNTADSYSKTSSTTALNQFRSARPTVNGDLAHLAALGGNNLGGVAWVDALCSSYKYAYSNISSTYQSVPTYSWTVEVMTHEMGHNLGSPHTQSCSWSGGALDNCYTTEGGCAAGPPPTNGGTIMSYCHLTSYGINFNNGFGTQPGNLIRNRVNAASCLGMCSDGSACNTPSGLSISAITQNSATASWSTVSGVTAYQLRYRTGTGSWTELAQQTTTSRSITGLAANTTYEVQVRSICSTSNSNYSSSVSFTTGNNTSCNTPTGLAGSNITQTTGTISWNAVSGAVNYTLDYKLASSSTWSTYTATSTTVNFTGFAANTAYNFRVRTNCSSGSSNWSSTITITTLPNSNVTYCASKGNNANYEWIDRVSLGSINNVTASNGGYGNFTHLSTNLTKGTSVTITLSAGMTTTYTEYWTVWIDYNRDGDFTDSGEKVTSFSSTSTGNLTRTFTIPTSAATGTTVMRVQMKYNGYSTSCETFSYGEVEDYTVNLVASGGLPTGQMVISNLEAYPSPFSDQFYVHFDAGNQMNTDITVTDINGKVVMTKKLVSEAGVNEIPLDGFARFADGIYIVNVRAENNNQFARVVKITQ